MKSSKLYGKAKKEQNLVGTKEQQGQLELGGSKV